jgi:hypothetical protein
MPRIRVLCASTHGHTGKIAARIAAADDSEEARAATRGYRNDFVERTGWTPGRSRDAVERWAHELAATLTPALAEA